MLQGDTYYSGEQWGQCQMCGAIKDVRESFCFSCADAQSIIGTGVDMYDKSFDGTCHEDGFGPVLPIQYTNDRLRLLIKNGWRPPLKSKEENSNNNQQPHGVEG